VTETLNGDSLEKASALLRGTEGSNPSPSTSESHANLIELRLVKDHEMPLEARMISMSLASIV
jgi:hypothetical protein